MAEAIILNSENSAQRIATPLIWHSRLTQGKRDKIDKIYQQPRDAKQLHYRLRRWASINLILDERLVFHRPYIAVHVTLYRRLTLYGHLDQSEADDISLIVRQYGPRFVRSAFWQQRALVLVG